jgi:hypothetical protein
MRRAAITLALLVLLPMAYVASFGPVCALFRADWIDRVTFQELREGPYLPLERWMWHGDGRLNDWYWRWHRWWDD